jgi:hypothetical protein
MNNESSMNYECLEEEYTEKYLEYLKGELSEPKEDILFDETNNHAREITNTFKKKIRFMSAIEKLYPNHSHHERIELEILSQNKIAKS